MRGERAEKIVALLDAASGHTEASGYADAGHLLILGLRELVELAKEEGPLEVGKVIRRLDVQSVEMVAGQLAMECVTAGWTPQGDQDEEGEI